MTSELDYSRATQCVARLRKEVQGRRERLRRDVVSQAVWVGIPTYIVTLVVLWVTAPISRWASFGMLSLFVAILLVLGIFSAFSAERLQLRNLQRILEAAPASFERASMLLRKREPFILYLYDFASGEESIHIQGPAVSGADTSVYVNGNHRREVITRKLHPHVPVVHLYNFREKNHKYDGISILADDDSWFDIVRQLSVAAKYVILDYRDAFLRSPAIRREIDHLMEANGPSLLFVGSEMELSRFRKEYPRLSVRIRERFAMRKRPTCVYRITEPYDAVDESDGLFDRIIRGAA
jgi:hypothetical protein